MAKRPRNELVFRIPEFDPLTLSMARLGEYITHLAVLYGEKDHIHFLRVARGSAALVKRSIPRQSRKWGSGSKLHATARIAMPL